MDEFVPPHSKEEVNEAIALMDLELAQRLIRENDRAERKHRRQFEKQN